MKCDSILIYNSFLSQPPSLGKREDKSSTCAGSIPASALMGILLSRCLLSSWQDKPSGDLPVHAGKQGPTEMFCIPPKQHLLEMFSAAHRVMEEPQRQTPTGMVSLFLLVPSNSALVPNLLTPRSKAAAMHGPECIGTESNSVPPKLIPTPHL